MTTHQNGLTAPVIAEGVAGLSSGWRLLSHFAWVRDWLQAASDYYAAALMYEQLSALSDAELHRRGLSRANLARDVCAACERTSRSP
jgi:hypothetical protein